MLIAKKTVQKNHIRMFAKTGNISTIGYDSEITFYKLSSQIS